MLPGLVGGGLLALLDLVPALRLTWHQPADIVAAASHIYVFDRLPHHLSILSVPPDEVVRRLTRHDFAHRCAVTLAWTQSPNIASRPASLRSFCSAALRRLTNFAWGAVALAAVGLVIELSLWFKPDWAAALLRYYWFRLTDVAVPLAIALNAIAF